MMSRRGPAAVIAVAVALSGVLVTAGVVFGQGADGSGQGDDGPGKHRAVGDPPDSNPVAAPAVAARANTRGGGELGVATYRNQAGQLCAALGLVDSGELRDHRGRAVPFDQAGNCTMRPNPVAVQVIQQADDPTTASDERSLIVWGLTTDAVERVEVAVGGLRESVPSGRDGAFIASLPPQQGQITLTLRRSGGPQEQLTLPAPPDIAELNKLLK